MHLLFKTLKTHRQPYKGFLSIYLLLALILSIAGVIMTRLTGDIGQAAVDMETNRLLQFIAIVTALMLIRAIASAASALLLGRFAARAGYRFRDNFAAYFLQKPFAKFEGVNSGEALAIYTNDIPATIELVSGGGLRFIADIIGLVVTFVYMLTITVPLTLMLFAFFPALMAMQIVIAIPIRKKQMRRQEARAELTAIVNDSLQNTSTIAAYSLENAMTARCDKAFDNFIAATMGYLRSFTPLVMVGVAASMAPLLVMTAVSATRVINGHMTLVEMIAFLFLAFEAGGWLSMLSQRQNDIQTGAAGTQRFMDAMDGEAEDLSKGGSLHPHGDVVLAAKNLTFAYPGSENNALDDVTFHIEKGARVAFVGGSGSGKSTVLKLLLGLYPPGSGEIDVLGENSQGISLESLRSAYAYVPQDSFLFPESIGANITGEDTPSNMTRLEKSCKDAEIFDFIQSLPQKYDAVLTESAENISGGQKQRIALARAFYRDAPIILFDEATSALDPATETAILKSFDTLAADKTVVMVSHRIKPIAFCDTIIVMDNGKVASIGSHETLLNTCPVYKNLYDGQTKGQDKSQNENREVEA